MISFTRAYQTSDGKTHPTLEVAKQEELRLLLLKSPDYEQLATNDILEMLVNHQAEVLAILSQKERQRVRAAKPSSRGVSKKRNGRASSLGAALPPSKESAADAPPLFGKDAA